MPRPLPTSRTRTDAAKNIFVNREEPIARFGAALDSVTPEASELLVFHGVGGQGKTALCREFARQAQTPERNDLEVSMLDLHARRDINPALALLWIRNALAACSGRSFAAFDVG